MQKFYVRIFHVRDISCEGLTIKYMDHIQTADELARDGVELLDGLERRSIWAAKIRSMKEKIEARKLKVIIQYSSLFHKFKFNFIFVQNKKDVLFNENEILPASKDSSHVILKEKSQQCQVNKQRCNSNSIRRSCESNGTADTNSKSCNAVSYETC